jgi:hypothetical protein
VELELCNAIVQGVHRRDAISDFLLYAAVRISHTKLPLDLIFKALYGQGIQYCDLLAINPCCLAQEKVHTFSRKSTKSSLHKLFSLTKKSLIHA